MPQPVKRWVSKLQSGERFPLELGYFGTFRQQPSQFHLPGMAGLGESGPNQGRSLHGSAYGIGGARQRLERPATAAGGGAGQRLERPAPAAAGRAEGPARARSLIGGGRAALEALEHPLPKTVPVI